MEDNYEDEEYAEEKWPEDPTGTRVRSAEQTKRLEGVAIALEEGGNVKGTGDCKGLKQFDMSRFVHFCGAPACALGYSGERTDLQKLMVIKGRRTKKKGDFGAFKVDAYLAYTAKYKKLNGGREEVDYSDEVLHDYFGLNSSQAFDLFSVEGCDEAETPKQAARFIRRFIKENPKY